MLRDCTGASYERQSVYNILCCVTRSAVSLCCGLVLLPGFTHCLTQLKSDLTSLCCLLKIRNQEKEVVKTNCKTKELHYPEETNVVWDGESVLMEARKEFLGNDVLIGNCHYISRGCCPLS